MQMDMKLNLSQKQRLILTQVMQQSINILQMSTYDLREYIDKQFEENPILEGDFQESKEVENYKEIIKYLKDDVYKDNYSVVSNEEEVSPFNFITEKKSLKDFLYEQLAYIKCSDNLKEVISYMIESLNGKGYLEISLEDICYELNIEMSIAEEALEIIQSLEPCGIGSRTLNECLKIQLIENGLLDDNLEEIITNYLEYVAENKYASIAKNLNIKPKEAQQYGDIIKSLEPKPSRGFYTGEEVKFIIPDAYIVELDNEIKVIMNNSIIPKLSVSRLYNKELSIDNKQDDEYVKEKIVDAMNLIKDIDARNSTLLRLLECIIVKQKDYFKKGKEYLKPMTLKDISNDIGLHESTISRAIKEKYILTSLGTIKIKELFCSGVTQNGKETEEVTVQNIKSKINELIKNENRNKPLSDQNICDILKKENVIISRRTVAKYREELGIKASSKRKRI